METAPNHCHTHSLYADEYGNGRMIEKLYMLKFHHCTMLLLRVLFLCGTQTVQCPYMVSHTTSPTSLPARHRYHIYVYCNGKRLFQLLIHIHTGPNSPPSHHSLIPSPHPAHNPHAISLLRQIIIDRNVLKCSTAVIDFCFCFF